MNLLNLSVLENLMMVPANQSGEKLMTALLLKPNLVRTEELALKQKAQDVVDFLNSKTSCQMNWLEIYLVVKKNC